MIITKKKPFEEILDAAKEAKSLFIIGCGDCSTLCRTGGEAEISEMKEKLGKEGISVTGSAIVNATCHELDTARIMRQNKAEIEKSAGILVLACGAGVQAAGDNSEKPVFSGCDSLFIGNSKRQMHFYEKCSACGKCILNLTGGICPVTRCPKGLLNGPCGGASGEKCEVNPENPCAWIEIYKRMAALGRLDDMLEIIPPKDNRASTKPHRIEETVRRGQ